MKFLSALRKILPGTVVLFLLQATAAKAGSIPERPVPPRLVNDFAGILSPAQQQTLEQKLVAFNDSTSTQIAVVTLKSLNGLDKAEMAYRIGESWGVGQKGKNNGVVILVKPPAAGERGEVFIAPGYGLEAVLPDALCKRIIETRMIPEFKKGDYFAGISNAVDMIMKASAGEYTAEPRDDEGSALPFLIMVGTFFVLLWFINNRRGRSHTLGRRPPRGSGWFYGFPVGGKSDWGSFSSGSGSFGGFGGGSFGGGGAGGSW